MYHTHYNLILSIVILATYKLFNTTVSLLKIVLSVNTTLTVKSKKK